MALQNSKTAPPVANISQDSILGIGALQAHPCMIYESENLLNSFEQHARDVYALILYHLDRHVGLPFGTLLKFDYFLKPGNKASTKRLVGGGRRITGIGMGVSSMTTGFC